MFDHDYISTLWTLSPYVENVVKYIAGFVVKKILSNSSVCSVCSRQLTTDSEDAVLIKIKNRGPLLFPSEDVCKICLVAERVFRQNLHIIFVETNVKEFLKLQVLRNISMPFNNQNRKNPILSTRYLRHRCQLAGLIIKTFLNIGLFYEVNFKSQKDVNTAN